MRLGIVDLGTNSVRFAIYENLAPYTYHCLYKKKMMLRPGQGVFDQGKLKPSSIRKVSQAFAKFARHCQKEGVEHVHAVGTSALREARNAQELIRLVRKKSGIEIKVISGREEALLIARGILAYENLPPRPHVLIDIGGGSTEVSVVVRGEAKVSLSLPLGALRLHQLFLAEDLRSLDQRLAAVSGMRQMIQRELAKHSRSLSRYKTRSSLGSSGTIRAVARLLDRPSGHTHSGLDYLMAKAQKRTRRHFTRSQLKKLLEKMMPLSRAEMARLPGMERRRLDIILSGTVLLYELMEHLGLSHLRTTNYALRDGLLLQASDHLKLAKKSA